MKQNKSNEKPSTKTSKSGCFWSIVFWGMVLFGVYLLLQDDKFSIEEGKQDTLHIKKFLGYKFGKKYSLDYEELDEPWFGFSGVHLEGVPLTRIRLSKYVKGFFWDKIDLQVAFESKYGIEMNDTKYGLVYDGKYTRIDITEEDSIFSLYKPHEHPILDREKTITVCITDKTRLEEQRIRRRIEDKDRM